MSAAVTTLTKEGTSREFCARFEAAKTTSTFINCSRSSVDGSAGVTLCAHETSAQERSNAIANAPRLSRAFLARVIDIGFDSIPRNANSASRIATEDWWVVRTPRLLDERASRLSPPVSAGQPQPIGQVALSASPSAEAASNL